MNNSFYKVLEFEMKRNFNFWLLLLLSFLAILTYFFFKFHSQESTIIIGGSFIPMFILFSCLFTLSSYSESTNRQTMIMYHLLPASGNTKFFSKQLITFFVFPFVLLLLYLILVFIVDSLVFKKIDRTWISSNFESIRTLKMFLWAHSMATFFGIVFKKRKLLYTIILFFSVQGIIGLFFVAIQIMFHNSNISIQDFLTRIVDYMKDLPEVTHFLIPAIVYFISYRLFFKRQL